MNRARLRRALVVIVLLILLAAIIAGFVLSRGGSERTAVVTRGSLQVTIQTVGRLAAKNPVTVRNDVDGSVLLVAAQTGDTVKQGDVVVQLDPAPYQQAVDQAKQAETDAESALSAVEQGLPANPSPEQTAQRLAAVQKVNEAKDAVSQAQDNLAGTLVLAPADGTLITVSVSAGQRVPAGSQIAQEADLTQLQLNVDLDEVDFPNVQTGMGASIRFDAFPGQEVKGTITRISPVAQTTGGTTTFPLTIDFTTPQGVTLRPGMNASVGIETAIRQNVLLIPQQALRTVGERSFVTVVTDGHHEEREIHVGLSSGGQVEVASGLSAGDRVVLH